MTKTIKIGLNIGDHDLNIKVNSVDKFLQRGNRVKVMIALRGRERSHPERGQELADKFISSLSTPINLEQSPTLAGGNFTFSMRPKKN